VTDVGARALSRLTTSTQILGSNGMIEGCSYNICGVGVKGLVVGFRCFCCSYV
jgi:hypothetical protein